jgi:hypothetical protein
MLTAVSTQRNRSDNTSRAVTADTYGGAVGGLEPDAVHG